ncbi:MAG: PhoH family protein [Gammaproteobacteria bacterium AqS3]|nr:PhoH family protein [Gammaproteobacteria bacterium AqS3]
MPDIRFTLAEHEDNRRLHLLLGDMNRHIRQIESDLGVRIHNRGSRFHIVSESARTLEQAQTLILSLYRATDSGPLSDEQIRHALVRTEDDCGDEDEDETLILRTPRLRVRPASRNQRTYIQALLRRTLTFAVGPAGTGKSFLAVATAVQMLQAGQVERIVLVRPVIEAGEKLGFLPGDINQKVDPYMRPLYDALISMLGSDRLNTLQDEGRIEVAPLAYMRGRTLNNAMIILDEAQNATPMQMKMFLTRLGLNSRAAATGDLSQIDLPKHQSSGLEQAIRLLRDDPDIEVCRLQSRDVLRHALVQRIVDAYAQDVEPR